MRRAWRGSGVAIVVALVLACAAGDARAGAAGFCGHQNAVFRGRHPYVGISDGTVQAAMPPERDCAFGQMAANGVGYYRGEINWAGTEYAPGYYDFTGADALVAALAHHHVHLLATLMGAPQWRSTLPAADQLDDYPPARPEEFGYFAALCVNRYGPHGSFWRENPRVPYYPVSAWQIWNEPNLSTNWLPKPDAAAYVRLLQGAYRAIKRVDRRATVVTAGMPFRGSADETAFLSKMYRAHMRGYLDALAIHPYSGTLSGAYQRLVVARRLMTRFRDRRSALWVTEIGWAGGDPNGFITNPRRQRLQVSRFFGWARRNRRRLRLQRIFWYGWIDIAAAPGVRDPGWWGYHLGMFTASLRSKPALSALASAAHRLDS